MDPATITIASLSLIASSVAIVMAFRAAEKAERSIILARETAEIVAKSVAAGAFNEKPTNEERIAYARGHIEACKGAELALADHANEFGAALLLAQYRAHAARALADLAAERERREKAEYRLGLFKNEAVFVHKERDAANQNARDAHAEVARMKDRLAIMESLHRSDNERGQTVFGMVAALAATEKDRDAARAEVEQLKAAYRDIADAVAPETQGLSDVIERIRGFRAEVAAERERREKAEALANRCRCLYCDADLSAANVPGNGQVIHDHIETCPSHPLAAARAEVAALKERRVKLPEPRIAFDKQGIASTVVDYEITKEAIRAAGVDCE